MIKCERIVIVPFDMKYLQEYCSGFNAEITRYQWPDPFETPDDAENVLRGFLDEMGKGETLLFSVLTGKGEFLGSVEVHGLAAYAAYGTSDEFHITRTFAAYAFVAVYQRTAERTSARIDNFRNTFLYSFQYSHV